MYLTHSIIFQSIFFFQKVPYDIKFSGTSLWNQLEWGGAFDVPMCDAIMRLYKSLDDQVYEPGHNRWRHFLPATFAVIFQAPCPSS